MIRAVLDSNTHISAAIVSHGYPAKIIEAWREGKFILITCQAILEEVAEVLKRSHIQRKYRGLNDKAVRSLINHLAEFTTLTPGKLRVEAVPSDPDDNEIISCAIEGEAGYIITGDPHLKGLKAYQGIRIVSPKEIWHILELTS